MKKHFYAITLPIAAFLLPVTARALTYAEDGAVLLGDEPTATSSNLVAAIGGADFSLACLGIVALMLAAIYIFHELWHPKRVHQKMTAREITQGSIRFYIGASLVWMLIAIMAEAWCTILPLTLIIAGALLYYIITLSSSAADPDLKTD